MRKFRAATHWSGVKTGMLAVCAGWFTTYAGFGQTSPPNDNLSNSIVLTGTDITFSGTLAGATLEGFYDTLGNSDTWDFTFKTPTGSPTQSVWWSWTAPTDTVLTVEMLTPSLNNVPGNSGEIDNAIYVYYGTNGTVTPQGLAQPPLGGLGDLPQDAPQTISVPVSGGSNYFIQLIGSSSGNYTMRLIGTNTRVIIQQPKTQTVYSNSSALFYVVYAGVGQSSFTFQWYYNGTNLPGETAPMLALTNIDASMAGAYTVAVSNSAGVSFSEPAMLAVSQSNYPVSLATIGVLPNDFQFSMAGEAGRTYRLKSSTNLNNWISEADFSLGTYAFNPATSVFFDTNGSQVLAAPMSTAARYFRVTPYVIGAPDAEICINNQRQIRIAKLLWERNVLPDSLIATPADTDIQPYLPHQALPTCPDDTNHSFDTSYAINNDRSPTVCQIYPTNHILEDPR